MPRIKTESLLEGMKVAADVKNIDGMLLLPFGCELSQRQISILQAWGVSEIDVLATGKADGTEDPISHLSPEVLTDLTDELMGLFWQPDEGNPAFGEIFKVLLHRRARQIQGK